LTSRLIAVAAAAPPRFFWAIGYSKPALDQLLQEYASLLSVH